jgi:alpha-L-arabinofuranosidase
MVKADRSRFTKRAVLSAFLGTLAVWVMLGSSCGSAQKQKSQITLAQSNTVGVTDVAIARQIMHPGVKRFGINLSDQTFYDSGQMLKNFAFRNPGFEGETWQSILRCRTIADQTCVDDSIYSTWPAGFVDGASYEILSGSARGTRGTILHSDAARDGHGLPLKLSGLPRGLAPGDFLLIHQDKPGDAQAGWWTQTEHGAQLATEFKDLPSATPGRQALRVEAPGPDQRASISAYFDSTETRSFLQMRGRFRLAFKAKWLKGAKSIGVTVLRADKQHHPAPLLAEQTQLTPQWQSYSYDFQASEDGTARGTVGLSFDVHGGSILLDDVSLVPLGDARNSSPFRDEVVETLRLLHPGILRFMDNGTSFGSTLDDLISPPFGRRRAGHSPQQTLAEQIPIGLNESLQLAEVIGAEPWYCVPATTSPEEAANLIEFLAGPVNSRYGAKRAKLGHPAPWTSAFPVIHLELGNELWNGGDFAGAAIPNPHDYATRANAVFGAARHSVWFKPAAFDLILGGQAGNDWLTTQELSTSLEHDSTDFAPYLFAEMNDLSSDEAIFGPLFAQPEQEDVHGSSFTLATAARRAPHPAMPVIYEVNMGTTRSKNTGLAQADIDRVVPSIGAAIAVADHMLLMLRELGITSQCLFALPEYANRFTTPGNTAKTTPLWGAVIDMGGPTNLRRPVYYALQLMNNALLKDEMDVHLTGANPTWDQPASTNDNVVAGRQHLLQTFAYSDGADRSLILINLSRTAPLSVTFSGDAPRGVVKQQRLTSVRITDNNEQGARVSTESKTIKAPSADVAYSLPPFSITSLRWRADARGARP